MSIINLEEEFSNAYIDGLSENEVVKYMEKYVRLKYNELILEAIREETHDTFTG